MQKKTLSFVCVDKVDLFINFAISFRQSFLILKTTLFDKLHSTSQYLTVPAIFMTYNFLLKLRIKNSKNQVHSGPPLLNFKEGMFLLMAQCKTYDAVFEIKHKKQQCVQMLLKMLKLLETKSNTG